MEILNLTHLIILILIHHLPGHQQLEMEGNGWDSDDEDNLVPLGQAQGQGLGKSLPLPHCSSHDDGGGGGGGGVGSKYLPSSCSVPYNTVFDDQFCGLPDSSKFPSSFMNHSSCDASFDSMALFRTGEGGRDGVRETFSQNQTSFILSHPNLI